MNTFAFTQFGATLETGIGSCAFFFHIFVFAVLTGVLHCIIALGALIGGDPSFFRGSSVGFSGVLFALIVIDVSVTDPGLRAVFGLFLVPAWLYPRVMLFIIQLVLRHTSFLRHLSGMVIGYAHSCGILKVVVTSQKRFGKLKGKCVASDRDSDTFLPMGLCQESRDRGLVSSIPGEGMTKNRFFSGHLRVIVRLKVLEERLEEDQPL
jgi:hypothetical protein